MRLKPFLLDEWLDAYEHDVDFNLGSSTGPSWTLNEILSLANDEERDRFLNHKIVYSRPAGADGLRSAIAEMHGVDREAVQVVTGASEALLILMWLAAEQGANVILPQPGFTTFSALPESLRIETRFYSVRRENEFRIDVEEIKRLADRNSKLILVNSPHNPTGATISDGPRCRPCCFSRARCARVWIVLPSPMSSARIPPRRWRRSDCSHARPSCW